MAADRHTDYRHTNKQTYIHKDTPITILGTYTGGEVIIALSLPFIVRK